MNKILLIICMVLLSLWGSFALAGQHKHVWVSKSHPISGSWEVKDGALYFGDDFKTDSAPDLFVYLSHKKIEDINVNENIPAEADNLGLIKAFTGSQRYPLFGANLTKYKSIVIYSRKYHTVWGGSDLK